MLLSNFVLKERGGDSNVFAKNKVVVDQLICFS